MSSISGSETCPQNIPHFLSETIRQQNPRSSSGNKKTQQRNPDQKISIREMKFFRSPGVSGPKCWLKQRKSCFLGTTNFGSERFVKIYSSYFFPSNWVAKIDRFAWLDFCSAKIHQELQVHPCWFERPYTLAHHITCMAATTGSFQKKVILTSLETSLVPTQDH